MTITITTIIKCSQLVLTILFIWLLCVLSTCWCPVSVTGCPTVFRIRKYFLRIRIREANELRIRPNADLDPTWSFVWPLKNVSYIRRVVNHSLLHFYKYFSFFSWNFFESWKRIRIQEANIITDPPDPDSRSGTRVSYAVQWMMTLLRPADFRHFVTIRPNMTFLLIISLFRRSLKVVRIVWASDVDMTWPPYRCLSLVSTTIWS
jgi:hypothetical protein